MKAWERWIVTILTISFVVLIAIYNYIISLPTHHVSKHGLSLSSSSATINHPPRIIIRKIDLSDRNTSSLRVKPLPSSYISSQKQVVVFDWPLDSDYISYLNYKSLESYLACCYTADTQIEIMLLGPNKANYYKVSKLMSKHTFSKYIKKGYSIKPMVHSDVNSLFGSIYRREMNPGRLYGDAYLQQEFHTCCAAVLAKQGTEILEMPIHTWYFARMARIYHKGGSFYDLTWFHQSRLQDNIHDHVQQGVVIRSYCFDRNTSAPLPPPPASVDTLAQSFAQAAEHHTHDHYWTKSSTFRCSSSAILYFPQPQHPVLGCVLQEYNDTSSVMMQCFRSSIMIVPHMSPDLRSYYDSLCIKMTFDRCFDGHHISNDLSSSSAVRFIDADVLFKESSSMMMLHDASLLWLGADAVSGQWVAPQTSSYIYDHIVNNNHVIQAYMRSSLPITIANTSLTAPCSHYASYKPYPAPYKAQAQLSCSLSFVLPGFMKAGTSYLFDMLSKHPLVLHTLKGVIFKETGCYYGEIIASHATSYQRMNCFPFVEPNDGLIYGDGTVYYIHRFATAEFLRHENPHMKAIILIRDPIERSCSHHRFSYLQFSSQGIPDFNMVVDIALAPGTRLDKLYHLASAAAVEYRYHHRTGNSTDGEAMTRFLRAIHSPGKMSMTRTYERCYNVFYPSLYFPFIYLWEDIMNSDNILVIEGERITPSRSRTRLVKDGHMINHIIQPRNISYTGYSMQRTMEDEVNDIFHFIGLNALSILPESFEHKTRSQVLPQHEMNDTSRQRLDVFYEPFNELLSIYLHRRRNNAARTTSQ